MAAPALLARLADGFAAPLGAAMRTQPMFDLHIPGWYWIAFGSITIISWTIVLLALIDVLRRPSEDYAMLDVQKFIVVLIVLLAGVVGVICYLIIWRRRLNEIRRARLAGTPMSPPAKVLMPMAAMPSALPPAGWFQMQGDPLGVQRWWDGARWTQHTHGEAMPPPSGAAAAPPPPSTPTSVAP